MVWKRVFTVVLKNLPSWFIYGVNLRIHCGRLLVYQGSQYEVLLFEPGCSAPMVIYLLEQFSFKK